MSGMISDTYAVVDKSKKTKSRNKASTQLPLDRDPVADLYSVVDKSNKSKPAPTTLTEDTYEAVPAENLYYNTVAAATDESAALYDSATYFKLDQTQVPLTVVNSTIPKKQTLAAAEAKHDKEQDRQQKDNKLPFCVIACFTILIIAVIAAAVAVAITFVLIAGLRSDFTAALKDSSSSSGNITDIITHVTNNLEPQLNMLYTDIKNFTSAITQQVLYLNQNASNDIDDIDQQINRTRKSLRELQHTIGLLTSSVGALEGNFSEQLTGISNATTAKLSRLNNEIIEAIMNSSDISVTTINTLQDRLANGIQTLHTFHSCEAVFNFSIQLPSGMYNLRAGNSSIIEYCFNIISFSCHGIPGRWKRIAYLSNDSAPVECPMGFELINDPNVPAHCRRNPAGARCSTITYLTHGNSYSKVCGTIQGSYFGDPDGFGLHGRSANTPLNGNYVDGISLTHGSMNGHHIWTLSAIVNFATNPTDICSVCASNKPSYVGMDYSCDVVDQCKDNCSPRQIWGSGHCIGNNTFYKNLTQPTSDDIEMRVCTDQAEDDEDIFLSFVELYVM